MITWYLGDNAIESAVREFAGTDEFINSASPQAIPELVWTEQVFALRKRRLKEPITIVIFLPQLSYDSEVTVWRIFSQAPAGSKLFYCMLPNAPLVAEGLTHDEVSNIFPVVLENLEHAYVLAQLGEVAAQLQTKLA